MLTEIELSHILYNKEKGGIQYTDSIAWSSFLPKSFAYGNNAASDAFTNLFNSVAAPADLEREIGVFLYYLLQIFNYVWACHNIQIIP